MSNLSPEEQKLLDVVAAFGQTIRALKTVPAGHLYARVMDQLTLEQFEGMLGALINAGLVRRDRNHLLTWIEPS